MDGVGVRGLRRILADAAGGLHPPSDGTVPVAAVLAAAPRTAAGRRGAETAFLRELGGL
ncbi:hypothetical protein [Streptomyces sp. BE20]|uniref:hypothetical protein n=1 Tax=Streptomyces sp. BE20 TaxID=3002525 RepID=UPI002E79F516|nr:hypothetical protein [Streptomyces sp. BE20]